MDSDQAFGPEDDEDADTPVAFVSTQEPIELRVAEIHDDRIPDDMICMGTFFQNRLIARSAVPPEALGEIESRGVFTSPVRLALAAVEKAPGLQCRLFALLPASRLHGSDEEPEEPWAASVPRYEDTIEPGTDEEEAVVSILLGHIVRFQKDRKHPGDLPAEAADVLRTVLTDQGPLPEVVDKVLDDLLDDS